MAGPPKKVRKESSSDDSENEGSEAESYDEQKEIEATFEGRNLEEQDFHGIKQLLQQLFLKAHVNLSELSEILIAQQGVGSVLKQSFTESEDEDDLVDQGDVFGVTSVINLTDNQSKNSIVQLYEFLSETVKKSNNNEAMDLFEKVLDKTTRLGLIINERFLNIPAKISDVMLNSLYHEIERIKKKNKSYNFDYFILISKINKPKGKNVPESEVIYSNDEEMIFSQEADCSCEYNVESETDSGLHGKWTSKDQELIPYRKIIVFKADKFIKIITQVQSFVAT